MLDFHIKTEKFVVVLFCSHNVLPIGKDGSIDRVEREREVGKFRYIFVSRLHIHTKKYIYFVQMGYFCLESSKEYKYIYIKRKSKEMASKKEESV